MSRFHRSASGIILSSGMCRRVSRVIKPDKFMIDYIIRRIFGLVPVFFGITLISFFVIHLAPGKPTDIQTSLNPKVSYEARLRMEKLYGLDKPIHTRYIEWLKRFV